MANMNTVGKHCTTVRNDADEISVVYQSTQVVHLNKKTGTVTLDSGRWRTATTKTRMNQAANQFGLGFGVYQRGGKWFVDVDAQLKTRPFSDKMKI